MTAENRWLFDFDDIKKVHFVCSKCKAALGVTPNAIRRVPPQCVNCNEQLYLNQDEQDCLRSLQAAFEAMGRFKSDKLKIRLDLPVPMDKPGSFSASCNRTLPFCCAEQSQTENPWQFRHTLGLYWTPCSAA